MCKQCNSNSVYEFTNQRKLCKNCFIEYFEKKTLYTIRKFHMIKNGDVIGYEDKKDFRSAVLKEILGILKTKAGIEISNKGANKIAINSTIDSEADEITNILIDKKVSDLNKVSPVENKIIKPLFLFLDEEVLLYAKLRNLKFKKEKQKKNKISEFIDSLEKKHPEIKRAIVNSYLKIYNREK
ncbi:MAG TPA: hypothetical protein VMC80_02360 [Patescibacteria group bacterium]|nr:hypothetical protein [Patescibacteria group bacterium]